MEDGDDAAVVSAGRGGHCVNGGEGHSSSRDVVVYPCVVASVDAHACVAVRCGVKKETPRCV